MFTAIRRWWCQTARHRCQSPFLHIRFDEHESGLSEVDVYGTGSVRADGWEEVLRFEAVGYVFEFLAIASEEDGAGPWTVATANDVALNV